MNTKPEVSLEDRELVLKKREARLAREKVKIREAKRKRDDAMKFRFGGLVLKAGLAGETEAVILGILVSAIRQLEANRAAYANIGDRKFRDDEARKLKQSDALPSETKCQDSQLSQPKTPAQGPQATMGTQGRGETVQPSQVRIQSAQSSQGQSAIPTVDRSVQTNVQHLGQTGQGLTPPSNGGAQAIPNQILGQRQS